MIHLHATKLAAPCAIALGKFESIHLGHQALIAELVKTAATHMLPSVLLVFEPHPYRVLVDDTYKPLLTSQERAYIVRGLGVDYLLEYPFSREFAALSADDFCHILFEDLRAKVIVVGEGYRYGRGRAGTIATLRQHAQMYGAAVHVVAPYSVQGSNKTSTSAIRALLSEGRYDEANQLLGYDLRRLPNMCNPDG